MTTMKQVIQGRIVSASELMAIPEESRLYWEDDLPHLRQLALSSEEERSDLTDDIKRRTDNATYECPEGSDITERVVSACTSGAAMIVVVECAHKTWARYPCQI